MFDDMSPQEFNIKVDVDGCVSELPQAGGTPSSQLAKDDRELVNTEEKFISGVSSEPEDPLSSSQRSRSALPIRLIRSLKNNLIRSVKPDDSCEFESTGGKKRTSSKKASIESQMEVARRVSNYLSESFSGVNDPHPLFVGENEPPIAFSNYVIRLIELTNRWVEERDGLNSFGVRCTILAVDYLEQIDVRLDSKSIHRYFMSAFLIAIKLLYDYYISNSFWAEVSGCPLKQVNQMEIEMCRLLRWDFTADVSKHRLLAKKFIPLTS